MIKIFIRKLPPDTQSSQRRRLIREFKAKLVATRENIANAQIEIEKFFRDNPNVPEEEAKTKVNEIMKKNTIFLGWQDFSMAVDRYLETRNNVKKIIARYRRSFENTKLDWEVELFKDLFNRYPNGKIKVEITLAGLYIRIFNIEDYVAVYTEGDETESFQKIARESDGAYLERRYEKLPELSNRITIENSALLQEQESRAVKTHEEEHAIHSNIHPQWLFGEWRYSGWLFEKNSKISYENFLKALGNFNKEIIYFYEGNITKTEILANLKEGTLLEHIRSELQDKSGPYDILGYGEKYVEIKIRGGVFQKMRYKVEKNGCILDVNEVVQIAVEAFRTAYKRNYQKDLELALDAVEKLLKKYGSDSENRMKIINLLSQEPLNKWPRLARILC